MVESIIAKNKAFRNAVNLKDNVETWTLSKNAKIYSQNLIRKSKATFIRTCLELNKNDPKKFWHEINTLIGAGKDQNGSIKTIQMDEQLLCRYRS